ncbi:hypothetical protein EDD17DRAFT_1754035 [Pisolithus thermaeus]|nr:hypothetical protein EDD17DRAFT_1754035 [Pisolithus thermaeus]
MGREDEEGILSNIGICTTDNWAAEQFDFTIGDGNRVGPNEDEEKEKEGDLGSMDMGAGLDSDSHGVTSKESGAGGEGGSSNIDACIADDQVAEQLDSAVGDSTGVALSEGEEREEEGSGSNIYSDMNLNSSGTDKDDGGTSNDGMLGNTFQLMDTKISSMPDQAGGLCQVGDPMAVGGKDKVIGICMEPLRSIPVRDVSNMMMVATFGPKHSCIEGAPNVKGKKKVPTPNPLTFSWPLECNFFMPSPLILDQPLP